MVTMDSAARAIDQMLHRGRAEERDGGVWLDDLAAGEVFQSEGMSAADWQALAEENEEDANQARHGEAAMTARCDELEEALRDIRDELDALGPLDSLADTPDSETVDSLVDSIRNALGIIEPFRVAL